jgi:hypothetical protein
LNRTGIIASAKIAVLISLVAGAVVVSPALMRAVDRPNETVPNTGAGLAQAIPDCDSDPAALAAIEAAVTAALAIHPLTPGAVDQVWRLHSICKKGDWAYAFVKGYQAATQAPLPSPSKVVLAQLIDGSWQVLLPDMGQAYNAGLTSAPNTLLPSSAKSMLVQPSAAANVRFAQYVLPYPAGQSA